MKKARWGAKSTRVHQTSTTWLPTHLPADTTPSWAPETAEAEKNTRELGWGWVSGQNDSISPEVHYRTCSKLMVNIAFSIDHALLEILGSFGNFETFIRIFDSEPAVSRHGSQTPERGSLPAIHWLECGVSLHVRSGFRLFIESDCLLVLLNLIVLHAKVFRIARLEDIC